MKANPQDTRLKIMVNMARTTERNGHPPAPSSVAVPLGDHSYNFPAILVIPPWYNYTMYLLFLTMNLS